MATTCKISTACFEKLKRQGLELFKADTKEKAAFIYAFSPLCEARLIGSPLRFMDLESLWKIANTVYCIFMSLSSKGMETEEKIVLALSNKAMSVFTDEDLAKTQQRCLHQLSL